MKLKQNLQVEVSSVTSLVDQEFQKHVAPTPKGPIYYLGKFPQNCKKMKKNIGNEIKYKAEKWFDPLPKVLIDMRRKVYKLISM